MVSYYLFTQDFVLLSHYYHHYYYYSTYAETTGTTVESG